MRLCPERRGNRFIQRRGRGKLRAVSQPTKDQRRQEIDALANELARANTHFHFFRKLHENYHELAAARDFWDYTLAAHFGTTLLQMARVYDTSKDGLNLQRLLSTVEKKSLDTAARQLLVNTTI